MKEPDARHLLSCPPDGDLTAAVREVIGLGLPEAMAGLFPELTPAQRDEMRTRYSQCYTDIDREPAGLFPGALEVMAALRERGHRLAVATGKGRRGLDRVLAGLGLEDFFDDTRCADETRSKPHPRMVRELLAAFGSEPVDSVVVGDSEYDLMMAKAAGVASVGVSYGVHSTERLMQHGPLAVLDHLGELLQLEAIP